MIPWSSQRPPHKGRLVGQGDGERERYIYISYLIYIFKSYTYTLYYILLYYIISYNMCIYIYVRKGIAKGTCWHPAAPAQVLGRVLLLPPFLGDQPAIDLLHLAEAGKLVETWEVLVVLSLKNLYEMWSKAVVEPWEPPNPPKSYPTNKKNKISRCWLVFSPNKAGTNLKPREMSVFPVTSFDILK
jgi:hypothetical protein